MKLNQNTAIWPEEILKEVINNYPELSEFEGSFKNINSDENGNLIGFMIFPKLGLSIIIVVKNYNLSELDMALKENKIVSITKENRDFIFSTSTKNTGTVSNLEDKNFMNDPYMEGLYEIKDMEGNVLGYSMTDPALLTDRSQMYGAIVGYPGNSSFLNKFACLSKNEIQLSIMEDILESRNMETKIAVADAFNDVNGVILPIETPVLKIAYSEEHDCLVGKKYKFAGNGKIELKKEELEDDSEEKQQIESVLKNPSKDVTPIGNIRIISITKSSPTEEIPETDITGNFESGDGIIGMIRKLISFGGNPIDDIISEKRRKIFIIPGDSEGTCKIDENVPEIFKMILRGEDDGISGINPEDAINKKVIIITKKMATEPLKVAMILDSTMYCENSAGKKIKIAMKEMKEDFINEKKENTIFVNRNSIKIAEVEAEGKFYKSVKKANLNELVFMDEEASKEASQKVQIKILINKDAYGYKISAHFAKTGRVFLEETHFRGEDVLKEQLKELGVPAAKASDISENAKKADSFAMTIEALADNEGSKKISEFIETENKKTVLNKDEIYKVAKLAMELISEGFQSDGLEILASSVINEDELEDYDTISKEIRAIVDKIKNYGLVLKLKGDDKKSKEVMGVCETLQKIIAYFYQI